MKLVIDIGNTRAKYGIFDGDKMVDHGTMMRRYSGNIAKKAQKYPIDAAILSNTSDPSPELLIYLDNIKPFIHLHHTTRLPITNLYGSPQSLGNDRLAAAVGAFARFAGTPCIIVDMGTCITVNYLSAQGAYVGGNISPGIDMRLKAMHHYTAKLPKVQAQWNHSDFGKDTQEAMQNGAVKGAILEIEGMILRIKGQTPGINVILTGGSAHFFVSYTKIKIFVSPNLVLEGLYEILKYNVK
ncbi:MAG: type III pantothenate kinase [Saprospiraceae bacterium]